MVKYAIVLTVVLALTVLICKNYLTRKAIEKYLFLKLLSINKKID